MIYFSECNGGGGKTSGFGYIDGDGPRYLLSGMQKLRGFAFSEDGKALYIAGEFNGPFALRKYSFPKLELGKEVTFDGGSDLHGVEYADGYVYLVRTGHQKLSVYREDLTENVTYELPGWEDQHYNDVCIGPDGDVYVSAAPRVGQGYILKNMATFWAGLSSPHSIQFIEGCLSFTEASLNRASADIDVKVSAFARGLCKGKDRVYYVGASDRVTGKPVIQRFTNLAGVLHESKPIKLEGREVYCIRERPSE